MTAFKVHHLRFDGDGSGRYPLTWAQRWIWRSVLLNAPRHQFLNIPVLVAVPGGRSVADALSGIAMLLGRHQALRTRFGVDEHGVPFQMVVGRGELPVEVHEVLAEHDVGERANELLTRLMSMPFTVPEVAVRAAVTTVGGRPTHVALTIFHGATDGLAMRRLEAELIEWLRLGRLSEARQKVTHPAARVAYEQSPEGMARSHRSIKYWEKEVARFPPAALTTSSSSIDGSVSFLEVRIHSRALAVAAEIIAARFEVSVAAVLTGLGAQVLCRTLGVAGVGFLVFCHNRFDSAAQALSGTLVQTFPLYVNVDATSEESTEALLKRVSFALFRGGRFGQYDPIPLADSLERLAAHQGWEPDLSYCVNINVDRTPLSPQPRPPMVSGNLEPVVEPAITPDWDALSGSSTMTVERGPERDDMGFYLTAWRVADEIVAGIRVDTARHTNADAEAFLKILERAAVQTAASRQY